MRIALGIDVGTTGIKSVLVDEKGNLLASESREQHQYFPQPGWCEQDGIELKDLCIDSFKTLLDKTGLKASDISCVGLDHQGESCLVWDKKTGMPVYPVITWQDRRMAAVSDEYGKTYGTKITELTGLRSDSYYSAWKIRWILDNVKDGQKRAENGELLAGTLNTWFFWNFTEGKSFVTDESSSDVMMLCDPRVTGWNDWLLDQMRIPKCMLPEIKPCNSILGYTSAKIFGAEIPITCSLADCSAGIIASGGINTGDMTVTYGTGNFLHMITDKYVQPTDGLTAACSFVSKTRRAYQINGICYTAGAAIKWLKNGLGLIADASETQALAESVPDTGGVYFVPALNGLASPFWDQSARAAFLGMSAATTKAHLVRAALESSALQVANCSGIIERVSGVKPNYILAMGGMTVNSFLMQLQADLAGIPVQLPAQTEPCYGAAIMAFSGIADDLNIESFKGINPPKRVYYPSMPDCERKNRIEKWCYAASRTLDWNPGL